MKCRTYTWDKNLAGRDGPYNAAEWEVTRRAAEIKDVYPNPTDENYRATIINARPDKVNAAEALCRALDFSQISRIGEIGGLPYIQAYRIVQAFPSLKYLATDQDAASNAILAQVPMLSSLNIRTFDATRDDLSLFDDCDWLITFAVDYALADDEILRLLAYVRDKHKAWALLSVTIIGIVKYLRLYAGFLERKLIRHPQRFHGWARSVGWYRQACSAAGLRVADRGMIGGYRFLWISQ